jgi:hypothetical protein
VAVRIESKEIAEGLNSDDCAGDGIIFRNRILDKTLQRLPGATAKGGKEFSIVKKIPPENLRNAENKMPMCNLFEDFHAQPLSEFHHTFLMAGWAKMAAFAGECQQVFMAAVFAFHTGKAAVQIATIQIAVNHLLKIRPPETVLPRETVVVFLHKSFKIVLNTAVVIRILRAAWLVNG